MYRRSFLAKCMGTKAILTGACMRHRRVSGMVDMRDSLDSDDAPSLIKRGTFSKVASISKVYLI